MAVKFSEVTDLRLREKLAQLISVGDRYNSIAVAVSGGVDSMVLAFMLHRFSQADVLVCHAQSPAVPESALSRIKQYAGLEAWYLTLINAKELEDPDYIRNPVNRCYFCKSNLYARIAEHASSVIFSGTNTDDLSDYRPGLIAASEHAVIHPYVEANISKREIYALARYFDLQDLKDLPAQPCLASRIETGIAVASEDLIFIDQAEQRTRRFFPRVKNIRCRLTQQGVVIELDELPTSASVHRFTECMNAYCSRHGYHLSDVRNYQRGSAFIHNESTEAASVHGVINVDAGIR